MHREKNEGAREIERERRETLEGVSEMGNDGCWKIMSREKERDIEGVE